MSVFIEVAKTCDTFFHKGIALTVFVTSLFSLSSGVYAQQPATRVPNAAHVNHQPVSVDVSQMSPAVQLQIAANKNSGKEQLDGILKGYNANIPACVTDAETQQLLEFLSSFTGFERVEFVSAGTVNFVVQPSFDSAKLKEALLAANLQFNFINEYFFVND